MPVALNRQCGESARAIRCPEWARQLGKRVTNFEGGRRYAHTEAHPGGPQGRPGRAWLPAVLFTSYAERGRMSGASSTISGAGRQCRCHLRGSREQITARAGKIGRKRPTSFSREPSQESRTKPGTSWFSTRARGWEPDASPAQLSPIERRVSSKRAQLLEHRKPFLKQTKGPPL